MQHRLKGSCATYVNFDIVDNKIYNVSFERGCEGNLKAIAILLEGMDANDAISKLKGNTCKTKPTSCVDQMMLAVANQLENRQ